MLYTYTSIHRWKMKRGMFLSLDKLNTSLTNWSISICKFTKPNFFLYMALNAFWNRFLLFFPSLSPYRTWTFYKLWLYYEEKLYRIYLYMGSQDVFINHMFKKRNLSVTPILFSSQNVKVEPLNYHVLSSERHPLQQNVKKKIFLLQRERIYILVNLSHS